MITWNLREMIFRKFVKFLFFPFFLCDIASPILNEYLKLTVIYFFLYLVFSRKRTLNIFGLQVHGNWFRTYINIFTKYWCDIVSPIPIDYVKLLFFMVFLSVRLGAHRPRILSSNLYLRQGRIQGKVKMFHTPFEKNLFVV